MLDNKIRINKYLAQKGVSTRKGADKMISAGKILINGRRAILGDKVDLNDDVQILGKAKNDYVYYAYNKPKGITSDSQKGEKDILSSINIKGVFPIGRLDKDSEGLIILTNDGRITDRLLSPKYDHEKEYIVHTRTPIKNFQINVMAKGMELEGIDTKSCKVKLLSEKSFSIILGEGQKHQIRRMCDALSMTIDSLKRVRVMNIRIGDLKNNQLRKIEGDELKAFLTSLSL
ncbi:MAG: pseudouridine synthase [Candidatus Taylorbacteria bacterium]|nr:pseudouridine synthase [Candidatus Taylorbacteria bacterium]